VYIEFLHVDSLIWGVNERLPLLLGKLTNVHKVTMNGCGSGHGGADQMCPSASALTAFKIAVAGACASLAGFKSIGVHCQAHRTTRFTPFKSSGLENFVQAFSLGLFFDQT
jgi:hypothetical protein